jgi:hypothetical protein
MRGFITIKTIAYSQIIVQRFQDLFIDKALNLLVPGSFNSTRDS